VERAALDAAAHVRAVEEQLDALEMLSQRSVQEHDIPLAELPAQQGGRLIHSVDWVQVLLQGGAPQQIGQRGPSAPHGHHHVGACGQQLGERRDSSASGA